MSKALKAIHADPVRSMSFKNPETVKRKSESLKRTFNKPEMKEKLLERRQKQLKKSGGVLSEETKSRISESLKEYYKKEEGTVRVANNFTAKSRKVAQYTLHSREYIASFVSIRQAGIKTGTSIGSIHAVLKGKCKHAGGFFWEYVKDE